jgi:hypothetical protein
VAVHLGVASGPADLQRAYLGPEVFPGAAPQPKYANRPGHAEMIARVVAITAVCQRHQAPLAAAALQFSWRHPRDRRSDPFRGRLTQPRWVPNQSVSC